VQIVDDSNFKIKLAKIPQTLEDKLKELNLETPEELHPIYVNSLLTSEKEEYFDLPREYKDGFVWSYQEMLRLHHKAAVNRLFIRRGVSPKMQPQRRFFP